MTFQTVHQLGSIMVVEDHDQGEFEIFMLGGPDGPVNGTDWACAIRESEPPGSQAPENEPEAPEESFGVPQNPAPVPDPIGARTIELDEQRFRYAIDALGWEHEAKVEIHGDIMIVHRAFPFLSQLVELVDEIGAWVSSTVIRGYGIERDSATRTSKSMRIRGALDPRLTDWETLLVGFTPHAGLETLLTRAYQVLVNPHMEVRTGEGYELLSYYEGDKFGEHVDNVQGNSDLGQRRLSMVMFCTEPEPAPEGEEDDQGAGGGTRFPRQGLTVEPELGTVVLFPSGPSHPHESMPVLRGRKTSLVTWFH